MLARHSKPPLPQSSSRTLTCTLRPRRKQAPTPPSACSHNRSVGRYSHKLTYLPTHMSTHTHKELDPWILPQPGSQTHRYRPLTWTHRGPRGDFRHPFPSHPLCFKGAAPTTSLALLAPQEMVFCTPKKWSAIGMFLSIPDPQQERDRKGRLGSEERNT